MDPLKAGDIAPHFVHPDDNGDEFDLCADHVAGRFLALVFCPDSINDAARQLVDFAEHHDSITRLGGDVVAISHESVAVNACHKKELALPYTILSDVEGGLFRKYGITTSNSMPTTVLLRPNRHVLNILHNASQAATALEIFSNQLEVQKEIITAYHPPVLVVPDVLDLDDCRRLINLYQEGDAPLLTMKEASEVSLSDHDFKFQVPDYGRQDRIDHVICSGNTQNSIAARLQSRLLPEIKRAFNYQVTSFEGLRIARYKGERRGKRHGHRDNSLPDVAYRRFAMSINLNEGFEGGELYFPEYGSKLYKPETGAAIVFSCSLLHDALEVRQGQRFVLLAFLFGET